MTSRERKKMIVYINRPIVDLGDNTYQVRGRKHRNGKVGPSYQVQFDPETGAWTCACPAFEELEECKHVDAVIEFQTKGPRKLGYDTIDESKRARYPKDTRRERLVSRMMYRVLPMVVRALVKDTFDEPMPERPLKGRPNISLADVFFGIACRAMYKLSGDLAQAYVDEAFDTGMLDPRTYLYAAPPATSTITAAMRTERILRASPKLLAATNQVYQGKHTVIGVDGSEHNIPTLVEGAEARRNLLRVQTVKLHAAVDLADGFVVAARVTRGKDSEALEAIPLLEECRTRRFVTGLSADKAYLSTNILTFCKENGIPNVAIPTKSNTKEDGDGVLAAHARAWKNRSPELAAQYSRRGIVEASFSRIKRLMSEDLRGRTLAYQQAELFAHVIVANVMWLVGRHIHMEIDLPFLDRRTRNLLEDGRKALKDAPLVDRTPIYPKIDPEAA